MEEQTGTLADLISFNSFNIQSNSSEMKSLSHFLRRALLEDFEEDSAVETLGSQMLSSLAVAVPVGSIP